MLSLNYLADLLGRHSDAIDADVAAFQVKGREFRPAPSVSMMGVVNLSQDSWYRESVVMNVDAAVRRGRRLHAEGADIVDLGAESSVLTARRAGAEAQIAKLVPVVQQLSECGILVSVESYLEEVTGACLAAGAGVVNLTAAKNTESFYRLAAEHDAGVVVCYIQNADNVRSVGDFKLQDDPVPALYEYFARQADLAARCGVTRLWLDPGLGFYYKNLTDSAERVRYQMRTFLNAFRLRTLGWPVCQALPHAFEYFEDEVRCAEPFFGVLALLGRTDLLRTHEVAKLRGVVGAMSLLK